MNYMKNIVYLFCCSILLSSYTVSGEKEHKVRVAKYKGDKLCAISYTFDDGLKEHYTVAAPELEKRGFRGTFWINGIKINEDNNHIVDTTRMSWPELKEMTGSGHEISNHGWSHANLNRITLDEVKVEIGKNDSIILEKIGVPSRTFCYPYNASNEDVVRLASLNRVGTRTKQYSVGSKSTPENLEKRVSNLIETRDWGVAMTHGISYGYDAFKNPNILWDHFDKVKAQEDLIWVGTFREVAAYIKECEDIKLKVTEKKKGLIVTPQLTLDKELFNEPLTLIIEQENIRKVSVKQGKKEIAVNRLADKIVFDFDPHGGAISINF